MKEYFVREKNRVQLLCMGRPQECILYRVFPVTFSNLPLQLGINKVAVTSQLNYHLRRVFWYQDDKDSKCGWMYSTGPDW